MAAEIQVHPRTVQRWTERLHVEVFRPAKYTGRIPAAEVAKLFQSATPYGGPR